MHLCNKNPTFGPSVKYLASTNMEETKKINKDLILRERLALQRTTLANQTTFLSFLRTALYFLIAAISVRNLLSVENGLMIEVSFFIISALVLILGIVNFIKHKQAIEENKKHVGNYQADYLNQ